MRYMNVIFLALLMIFCSLIDNKLISSTRKETNALNLQISLIQLKNKIVKPKFKNLIKNVNSKNNQINIIL